MAHTSLIEGAFGFGEGGRLSHRWQPDGKLKG
jgi:hypothetical protein